MPSPDSRVARAQEAFQLQLEQRRRAVDAGADEAALRALAEDVEKARVELEVAWLHDQLA